VDNTLGSLIEGIRDASRPVDQPRLQRTLEDTLFTFCDEIQADQIGMHWSFDWLFAPREAFALSVGRWFELNRHYCHVTFKHQCNHSPDTRGTGVIFELKLPLSTFRFNAWRGRLAICYQGPVEYQIQRLDPAPPPGAASEASFGWVSIDCVKELWRPGRHWSNRGEMELRESDGGPVVCRWRWDYAVSTVVDRPDYDAGLLLPILRADLVPSGNGHFIPAMRASLRAGSVVEYEEPGHDPVSEEVAGAYLDGNYGVSRRLDRLVTDRWAWMAAPQLWTPEGVPSEHMMTFGFFQKPLLPVQPPDTWTGAVLWRSGGDDMTRFGVSTLLDSVDVRAHGPGYLDVSITTAARSYRVTVRAWSQTMTTPLSTPSGSRFHDHQDLLADAYVVIEENLVPAPWRAVLPPRWAQTARLVTNMFGFEFGEQDRVIGAPGYPAYDAVPAMPPWLTHALARIPDALGSPTASPRLAPVNS
jgi:hypothetical protein